MITWKKAGVVLISLLIMVFLFFSVLKTNFTGKTISEMDFPNDCESNSIQDLWDSVFVESSSGIQTISSADCDDSAALKTSGNESYILIIENSSTQKIYAYHGNFTGEYIAALSTAISDIDDFLGQTSSLDSLSSIPEKTQERTISSASEANTTYNSVFENPLPSLSLVSSTIDFYNYSEYGNSSGSTKYIQVKLFESDWLDYFFYQESICVPDWTRETESCRENETMIVYYTDSNSCGVNTGKPANTTDSCDYDENGIIGNATYIMGNEDLTIYISGVALNSSVYSGKKLVQIKRDDNRLISFVHNFANGVLDFTKMTIDFNGEGASFGSVIINGLNDSKWVMFDRKNSSSVQVCVKDANVTSITNISSNCDEADEFPLSCPNFATVNSIEYSCNITGNYFNVSGLLHSAVREVFAKSCTQNWSCSLWSNCSNGTQTRTCSDLNYCGNLTGKPSLSQSCTGVSNTCKTNWTCTAWTPSNCSSDTNQTRSCSDLNKCGVQTGKPSEKQLCQTSSSVAKATSKAIYWAITIISIFLFFLILGMIIYTIRKNKNESTFGNDGANVYPKMPPVSPQMPPATTIRPNLDSTNPQPGAP